MNDLTNAKIIVVGLAREGISTLHFLRQLFPDKQIAVADAKIVTSLNDDVRSVIEKDAKLTIYCGKDYLSHLSEYDVIIKSAGVPLKLLPELSDQQIVTSPTQLFFDNCQGTIIGVTGTKGKSTTTSVIYEVLKKAGKKVVLCGNIGIPALDMLSQIDDQTLVVMELSSHQLQLVTKSPHIAVLQNIVPEHLDFYKDFDDYVGAKANIAAFQTPNDYFLYNAAYPIPTKIAAMSRAVAIPFNKDLGNTSCFIKDDTLIYRNDDRSEAIMSVADVGLRGAFNLQNIMPAVIIGKLQRVPNNIISQAISGFTGLEDRLELAGTVNGVDYYNDSLSTVPEATMAAMEALAPHVETMLLGGFDRGLEFAELAKKIIETNIKTLVFFPTTGERIWQAIEAIRPPTYTPEVFFVDSMQEAVRIAKQHTQSGNVCLLSPASPSFGIFKDYHDRGVQFKQAVQGS